MIAEPADPVEPTEAKKESKQTILSFIGKTKAKEKALTNSIKLISKESKR